MFDHQIPVNHNHAFSEVFRLLLRLASGLTRSVTQVFTLPRAEDYVAAMVAASRQRGEATCDWLASANTSPRN
ncbi:MAG: hypothetical protein LH481_14205 [Burkholderiales bacterium]|nr:hypothetical protein [Burkholderiales bacterium]